MRHLKCWLGLVLHLPYSPATRTFRRELHPGQRRKDRLPYKKSMLYWSACPRYAPPARQLNRKASAFSNGSLRLRNPNRISVSSYTLLHASQWIRELNPAGNTSEVASLSDHPFRQQITG